MDVLSPELIQTLFTIGGTPLIIAVLVWKFSDKIASKLTNGSSDKINGIAVSLGEHRDEFKEHVGRFDKHIVKFDTMKEDFQDFRLDTSTRLSVVETTLKERAK